MADTFSIENMAPLLEKLRTLPAKVQKKALQASLRKGANIVKAAAIAHAPDDPATPANIKKEIVVRADSKMGRQVGGVVLHVGVKGGARKPYANNASNRRGGRVGKTYQVAGNVYWWRFLEFGTEKMKAQPFMRPALAEHITDATNAVATELDRQMTKLVQEP